MTFPFITVIIESFNFKGKYMKHFVVSTALLGLCTLNLQAEVKAYYIVPVKNPKLCVTPVPQSISDPIEGTKLKLLPCNHRPDEGEQVPGGHFQMWLADLSIQLPNFTDIKNLGYSSGSISPGEEKPQQYSISYLISAKDPNINYFDIRHSAIDPFGEGQAFMYRKSGNKSAIITTALAGHQEREAAMYVENIESGAEVNLKIGSGQDFDPAKDITDNNNFMFEEIKTAKKSKKLLK